MGKACICEVVSEFDEDFDGSLCRVVKVLQVFDSLEEAQAVEMIFDPSRYGDYDTYIRVVPVEQLDNKFR